MTPEQGALLERARSSIAAARLLSQGGFQDYAVARAYYAMFYLAQAMLLGEGLSFSKHAAVISGFGKTFVKTGRVSADFHRYLIKAQESRNVGDYDMRPGLSLQDAQEQIDHAKEFLSMVEGFLGKI